MRQTSFVPIFVDTIPEELDDGHLYISTRFRTASHLCACGCGSRVVTPIKPAKWRFTYDGEVVSLHPSVGCWQHPCRSHYVIRRNNVEWARKFNDAEIAEVLRRDSADLRDYYDRRNEDANKPVAPSSWWKRQFRRMRRR